MATPCELSGGGASTPTSSPAGNEPAVEAVAEKTLESSGDGVASAGVRLLPLEREGSSVVLAGGRAPPLDPEGPSEVVGRPAFMTSRPPLWVVWKRWPSSRLICMQLGRFVFATF